MELVVEIKEKGLRYRIIDGRGTGKTRRLLLLAKENNGVVVCINPTRIREKAYAYGLTGIDFMSYTEYIANSDKVSKPVYIDKWAAKV